MSKIEVRNELFKMQDLKYGEFNTKLCPDTNKKMIGIRVPNIRQLAKKILKEDWKVVLESLKDEYFEEVLLKGFVIAYLPISLEEKLPLIQSFIPLMDSWAITDSFVPTLKVKKKDLELFWNFILPYIKSAQEFEVRFAIISMLDYYLTEEYVDQVITMLDSITHQGYYVKMAVAWTLAEIGIKFSEKAMTYLQSENHLDKFTYNKTLQKMIESYRINSEQKDILRKMKRK